MVFVSLEGCVAATPNTALDVVVTPGSPPKPVKNVSPVKVFDEHYVIYVRDSVPPYALSKSYIQIAALHGSIQATVAQHPCSIFACCGPLRILARSQRPQRPSKVSFRFEASITTMDKQTTQRVWHVEEFVNDLLRATCDRDADCPSLRAARTHIETFLELPTRRQDKAANMIKALQVSVAPDDEATALRPFLPQDMHGDVARPCVVLPRVSRRHS
ncbi:hypothetical protein AeNC1_011484 [Aphanomyces euteiches]|nr:hypothetical protein AeNC1_011484 [Aphanomyces euteiches]